MDQIIAAFFDVTAAWILGMVLVLAMAISILFYLQIALFLIGGVSISLFKFFSEKLNYLKRARPRQELWWNSTSLGITMQDGGEPMAKEKKKS